MKDLCQQCSSSRIGAEVIPGLLESIRNATSERREYGKGKKATFWAGARAEIMV